VLHWLFKLWLASASPLKTSRPSIIEFVASLLRVIALSFVIIIFLFVESLVGVNHLAFIFWEVTLLILLLMMFGDFIIISILCLLSIMLRLFLHYLRIYFTIFVVLLILLL